MREIHFLQLELNQLGNKVKFDVGSQDFYPYIDIRIKPLKGSINSWMCLLTTFFISPTYTPSCIIPANEISFNVLVPLVLFLEISLHHNNQLKYDPLLAIECENPQYFESEALEFTIWQT